jgi:hypothetical protein
VKIVKVVTPEKVFKSCLVDDVDFDYLDRWSWSICNGYAKRTGSKKETIYMHVEIARRMLDQEKIRVTHKNGDRLDNRRDNLEVIHRHGMKGIYFDKTNRKWKVRLLTITNDGKKKMLHLGYFDQYQDAVNRLQSILNDWDSPIKLV